MSLLREIQDAATNDTGDLTTVLRKCRILATRLKHNGLKNWTQNELDGYLLEKNLPDYRVRQCHSFGNFFGTFGRQLQNAPIPLTSIPEEFRKILTQIRFQQGVAGLQDMVKRADKDTLQNRWPADAYKLFGHSIYDDMVLMEAWNIIPVSFLVNILDTVRNRILNFALEIEEQIPEAANLSAISSSVPSSKIRQIFNTTIYGSVGNMATAGQNFSQLTVVTISQDDFEELSKFLKDLGFDNDDVSDLKAAIKADGKPKENGFGKRVAEWFGKAVAKSAQGMLKIGTDIASKIISEAISQYYGLPK
jgi:AbiTii